MRLETQTTGAGEMQGALAPHSSTYTPAPAPLIVVRARDIDGMRTPMERTFAFPVTAGSYAEVCVMNGYHVEIEGLHR